MRKGVVTSPGVAEGCLSDQRCDGSAHLCEAQFLIGTRRLLAKDEDGAAEHFRACVDTELESFHEWQSARAELEVIEKNK